MDKKTWPVHMLPTRDPPQKKKPTQTESEGLETNFPNKRTGKKAGVAMLIADKTDFKGRAIKRDPECHFIILEGRIHQEDINIVNIYAPIMGATKHIKKLLEDVKKDIDSNTIIVGDFNTPLSKMDRSSKQNINKDVMSLNTETFERFSSQRSKINILFKCTWDIFKDRLHDRTQSKPQQIQEN